MNSRALFFVRWLSFIRCVSINLRKIFFVFFSKALFRIVQSRDDGVVFKPSAIFVDLFSNFRCSLLCFVIALRNRPLRFAKLSWLLTYSKGKQRNFGWKPSDLQAYRNIRCSSAFRFFIASFSNFRKSDMETFPPYFCA